jgi:CRP/FNR family cyclic AMP-dependent transcriptional regulator
MSAPVDLLRRVPLFQGLDDRQLETLSRTMKDRTFRAGQTVATEGQGGVGFFIVESGEGTISVAGDEKGKIGPGDYFGEVALIDEGARSATITADSDLTCWGLTPWEFRPLVESNATIAWPLLKMMAERLRRAEQR